MFSNGTHVASRSRATPRSQVIGDRRAKLKSAVQNKMVITALISALLELASSHPMYAASVKAACPPVVPPPVPLVCVEENPGPSRRKNKKSKRIIPTNGTSMVPYKASNTNVAKTSQRKLRSSPYYMCLFDPFNRPPIRLGWGTLGHTDITTSTVRGTFTCTAIDGSGYIVLNLINSSIFGNATSTSSSIALVNDTGAASIDPFPLGFTLIGPVNNAGACLQLYTQVRVLAASMKVTPLIPSTAVPVIFDLNNFSPLASGVSFRGSTNSLSSNAASKRVQGTQEQTVSVNWLPYEAYPDYSFTTTSSATSVSLGSYPYIGFYGATGYVYSYEIIVHSEVMLGTNNANNPTDMFESLSAPTAEDYDTSASSGLRRFIKAGGDYIQDSLHSITDATSSFVNTYSAGITQGVLGAATIVGARQRRLQNQ
jgi:hypothetical protein